MISLARHGDAAACGAASGDLRRTAEVVSEARAALGRAVYASQESWDGTAARAFRDWAERFSKDIEELHAEISRSVVALAFFTTGLERVDGYLSSAQDLALAHGLTVSCETIAPPPAPILAAVMAGIPPIDVYAECAARVEHARDLEDQIHRDLRQALARVAETTFLVTWLRKAGLLPYTHLGAPGITMWAGGVAATAAGSVADWMIRHKYGRFAPRVNGSYISPNSLSWSKEVWARTKIKNFQAQPGQRIPFARAKAANKILGRAGGVLAGGTAVLDQWQIDSSDPTIEDTERVTRAAFQGAGTGLGAYGGAWAGAQGGAAIGTMVAGPVGTVVGGIAGGIIFGLAGSEIGGQAGDLLKGPMGNLADSVAGLADTGWNAAKDKLGDFGSAATFWRD